MPAFLLALALAAAPPAPPVKAPVIEPGTTLGAVDAGAAPTDDFGFVSWCAGAVEGYLKLKPEVLPEVRRIEGQYHPPGANLEQDMKDYADLEVDARRQMISYQQAIQAAEKASTAPISDQGFAAYKRGLAVWAAPAGSSRARIAQEWMSWSLPAKCETTAQKLTTRSSLFGEALQPSSAAPAPSPPVPAVVAASGDTSPSSNAPAVTAPASDAAVVAPAAEPTTSSAPSATAPAATPKAVAKPARKAPAKKKTTNPG